MSMGLQIMFLYTAGENNKIFMGTNAGLLVPPKDLDALPENTAKQADDSALQK